MDQTIISSDTVSRYIGRSTTAFNIMPFFLQRTTYLDVARHDFHWERSGATRKAIEVKFLHYPTRLSCRFWSFSNGDKYGPKILHPYRIFTTVVEENTDKEHRLQAYICLMNEITCHTDM